MGEGGRGGGGVKFFAVTHRHTAYVEAESEAAALESCADQVRDHASAEDCTAEEIDEREYEQQWELIWRRRGMDNAGAVRAATAATHKPLVGQEGSP
jgi:hypothetical protein